MKIFWSEQELAENFTFTQNELDLLKGKTKSSQIALQRNIFFRRFRVKGSQFWTNFAISTKPIPQKLDCVVGIKKRQRIIKNINRYSLLKRTNIAEQFFKDLEKYKISDSDKVKLADQLFKVNYGVGGEG